jgi:cytochrome c oxidase cbb3-type subunit 3
VSILWTAFVVVGTLGTFAVMLWLLISNRKATPVSSATQESAAERTTHHEYDGILEYDNPLPMWWVWLFVATLAFGLVYLVWYPGLGGIEGLGRWTSAKQLDADRAQQEARFAPVYQRLGTLPTAELVRDRQAQQIGRRLFLNNCATCHGTAARGGFGFPDLADDEWLWGGDLAAIEATITSGRNAAMPAWGAALGESGVTDTAAYVLSLSGQPHDAEAGARGAQHYATFCVACHGADGRGSTLFGAPDLTNASFLYGSSLDEVAFTIRNGRNGQMPAQAGILGADKIRILAAYVYGLQPREPSSAVADASQP